MSKHSTPIPASYQDPATKYRDVPGFPGYLAGSDGSIWSNHKCNGFPKGGWHIMQGHPQGQGKRYRRYSLRKGGRLYIRSGHRLILEAFRGPCPDGMVCRHLDGDPTNNRLENLCWGTHRENSEDSMRHGVLLRGSRVPGAKLTEQDVLDIRRLNAQGHSQAKLARIYKIALSSIGSAIRGSKWKHVPFENYGDMTNKKLTWRIVRNNRRIFGWHWWLQYGWWRTHLCWSGVTRKRFKIEYEEPHPTQEAAEKALKERTKKS